ncbi:MAG: toll/interleukin-1 receptor domain-containing protein [Bacteroidota bacterium]
MLELTKEQIEKADILLTVVCSSKSPIGSEIAHNLFNSKDVAIHVCTIIKELGLINVIRETENDPFYLFEPTSKTCDYVKKGGFSANYNKMDSSENELLGKDTIQVLESLLDGNSYTITKDRPKEIMDLLPKLDNLDILRKTDRYKYGINSGGRQQLKKLIQLKSWKDFLSWIDENHSEPEATVQGSQGNKESSKRYILLIKTQTDSYNVIGIDVGALKYVIEKYLNKENDFSLGGTKYFLRGLLDFKIYEFNNEGSIDRFLEYVESRKLKSKTLFDESYIGKDVLAKVGKDVSEVFLDSFTHRSPTNKAKNNEKMIDIFISHSSSDREKVEILIGILRSALNLEPKQIRCTSVPGYKLTGGSSTDETLRQEIVDCKVFLGVLTENSIISTYVLFELGARWGLNKPMKPIVCEPSLSKVVKGPLTGLHCLNGSLITDVIQLVEECAAILNIQPNTSDVYLVEAEKFAALSKKTVPLEKFRVREEVDVSNIKASDADEGFTNIKKEAFTREDEAEARKAIQNKVKVDYPNDYSTQEYVFNEQMAAFSKLQNPPKEWLSLPEFGNIYSEAAKTYPMDYSTRLYVIEEQIQSLVRLKGMGF